MFIFCFTFLESLSSELEQERKARLTLQEKLKGEETFLHDSTLKRLLKQRKVMIDNRCLFS